MFYLSIDAIYSKLTKLYCSNCMLPCQSGGVYLTFDVPHLQLGEVYLMLLMVLFMKLLKLI